MSFAENNKRAAKNTMYLYFRMIVIILVNLYTTRVVLAQLGVTDYGVYSAIGGLVTMFGFVINSMTVSTQRFITFELGKGDMRKLNEVFCTSVNIHIAFAVLIAIVAETVGVWFLNTKMTIPPGQMTAANWVLQFSMLTLCVNIIQVPYNALIIAHERMNIFAYISILEAGLKLATALILIVLTSGKLIWYAAMVFVAQLLVRLIYQVYCRRNFAESKYCAVHDMVLVKEMGKFAGWNSLMALGWAVKTQGCNLLLNVMFGPVLNAAMAIVTQIKAAVFEFVRNFMNAITPQITKYYAAGEIKQMENLSFHALKYSFMLILIMVVPLSLNIGFLLDIWLDDVPPYTVIFTIYVFAEVLVNSLFDTPLMNSLAATGNIRCNALGESVCLLLILPVSYVVLRLGAPPQSIFIVGIILLVCAGVIRFRFCRLQLGYSTRLYARTVLIPALLTTIAALPVPMLVRHVFDNTDFWHFTANILFSFFWTATAIWLVALRGNERHMVVDAVKTKLHIK